MIDVEVEEEKMRRTGGENLFDERFDSTSLNDSLIDALAFRKREGDDHPIIIPPLFVRTGRQWSILPSTLDEALARQRQHQDGLPLSCVPLLSS